MFRGLALAAVHKQRHCDYNGAMSSLFSKLKTLVKASIPRPSTRDSGASPAADSYVSDADLEAQLERAEQQATSVEQPAAASKNVRDRLMEDAETIEPPLQEIVAEAPAVVEAVRDDVLGKVGAMLDSAESEIATVATDGSNKVKQSAEQANALIEKARDYAAQKSISSQPPTDQPFDDALSTLDSAAEVIPILPSNATDRVKQSAKKANELIEKARDLIDEKSAQIEQLVDDSDDKIADVVESLPDTAPASDNDNTLDDIKSRLG